MMEERQVQPNEPEQPNHQCDENATQGRLHVVISALGHPVRQLRHQPDRQPPVQPGGGVD
ncbi:hypothetical protein D3C73_1471900 [compost metagenome]